MTVDNKELNHVLSNLKILIELTESQYDIHADTWDKLMRLRTVYEDTLATAVDLIETATGARIE